MIVQYVFRFKNGEEINGAIHFLGVEEKTLSKDIWKNFVSDYQLRAKENNFEELETVNRISLKIVPDNEEHFYS